MPKKKRTPTVPSTARPQRPRHRRERTRQALVLGLGGLAIAVIFGLTVLALYLSRQGLGGTTALEVGDTSFTTGYLLRRLRLLVDEGQPLDPFLVANMIAQEETVRQQAGTLDVFITPEEVDEEIADQLGVSLGDGEAFAAAYQQELERTGLSEEEFRQMVEARVLERKVRFSLTEQVPPTADQAFLRLILVPTQADAQTVLERLEAGEEFADLAQELSLDSISRDTRGELGWTARGLFGDDFDEAVFALDAGQRSGPITTDQGVYIVEVDEKASDRELTPEQRSALGDRAFADWLTERSASVGVFILLDQEKFNWVLQRALPQGGGG
ncbi:MAG: peptidylprolyl isomerase [Dehalococcoidia bacterium]